MSDIIQRKSLEKILLVNWSRFAAETIIINNSVLFAGANGTGKSTVLDAIIYAVTGCKQFNKAADDKERTVLAYVRGDTKSTGGNRFLRSGAIVSYVVLEFFSELENTRFVTGVYIESSDDISVKPYWFVRKDAAIEDFNFITREDKKIIPTVKSELCVKGERLKSNFFLTQTNGVEQVLRALGLKNCKGSDYAGKLLRMMAIKPEKDINAFIRESVLAEKPVKAIEQIREGKQKFDELKNKYNGIIKQKEMLEKLEEENLVYEKACRNAEIKQYIAYYQDLKSKEILKGLHQSKLENDNSKLLRLRDELEELEQKETAALKAKDTAQRQYDEQDFDGNIRELERKSDEITVQIRRCEKEIAAISELQRAVSALLDNPVLGLSADGDRTLLKLNENIDLERKYSVLPEINQKIKTVAARFRQSAFELKQEIDNYDLEISELSNDIRKLENKTRTFPREVEVSRKKLQEKLRSQGLNIDVHILAELVTKVVRPEWQQAIECFMGRDRYALVVEDNYVAQINEFAAEIFTAQNELRDYELKHLDIKAAAREEYDKHISGHEDGILYSQNTIRRAETDRQKNLEELVKLQIKFCQFAGIDISKSGEMYIGYYRELKNELMNVKAEETRQKLEDTGKNLESTFVADFVAQINENIKTARDEIDKINAELEALPFGNDIYKFKADERSDKAAFFKIAKHLNPEGINQLSLLSDSNEALENDIKEFMDIILSDSVGTEFEDYRSYLEYDMEIKNNKNESFDLSKKQGSASNGEKQTPFYIILAASLMQCYPRNVNCARLALVDEAFAALSGERIEQMVKYFEKNGFQVLYAAPPNKIQSIGSYISSTISLVEAGRYTKAVEGLVDDIIESSE